MTALGIFPCVLARTATSGQVKDLLSLKQAKPNSHGKSKVRAYYIPEGFLQTTNKILVRYSQFRDGAGGVCVYFIVL